MDDVPATDEMKRSDKRHEANDVFRNLFRNLICLGAHMFCGFCA